MNLDFKQKARILGVIALVIGGLLIFQPAPETELETPAPVVVATVPLRIADVHPIDRVTGRLVPSRTARMHFEVAGRVTQRFVEPGNSVRTGDQLLNIDDGDLVDALTEAQASLVQEQAAVARDKNLLDLLRSERKLQESEVGRMQQLKKQSLASQSQSDAARQKLYKLQADEARLLSSVQTAAARIDKRNAARNRARRNLDRAHLTSPFDAIVNVVTAEVGDYVSPGQVAIDLIKIDSLDLYAEVSGVTARSLVSGSEVEVLVEGVSHIGKVIALAPDPDPKTHSHALRVRLPGAGLAPGQLAIARLPLTPLLGAQSVPVTAVLQEDGVATVYTVSAGKLQRKIVKLIRRDGSWQVVTGLEPDVTVVARDVAALTDGQFVAPDDVSKQIQFANQSQGKRL